MALASAAPAKAVPEVLRNSRRVVRLGSVGLVEFIVLSVFEFAKCVYSSRSGLSFPSTPLLARQFHAGASEHSP